MRLKYYLRGLGIGIAVTALLMGVYAKENTRNMTDAQIIARAKELGMVDGVLSEISETEPSDEAVLPEEEAGDMMPEETSVAPEPDTGTEGQGSDAESAESAEAAEPEMDTTNPVEADGAPDHATAEQEQPEHDAGAEIRPSGRVEGSSTVIVAIYPGEGSYAVSRKLATLGLVESAEIYDGFLCQNGYDKKLCTGNYEIQEGATAEEIARIITKNQ